jgi:hypothetical protein
LEGAKEAGFIQPQNLSLVTIIDLENEGEGEQWGTKVVKALEEWTPPVSPLPFPRRGADIQNAGYGLKWDEKEKEKQV